MPDKDCSLTLLQDAMSEIYSNMKALRAVISILESGFESINDDNCTYVIASLKIIEEQLEAMTLKLKTNIIAIDSMMK
jgi:hypothetical protein